MTRRGVIATLFGGALVLVIGGFLLDPLNRFALRMSLDSLNSMPWRNGLSGIIDAPASAKPEDLIAKSFFKEAPHGVLELHRIYIVTPYSRDACIAALVERDGKQFIWLYWHDDGHWNWRTYPE